MKAVFLLAALLALPGCVVEPYPTYGYAYGNTGYGYANPAVPALVGAAAGAAIGYGLGQAAAPRYGYYERPVYYRPYYAAPYPRYGYYRGW